MSEYFISRAQAESDLLDCAAFLAERIRSSDGHAEAMNAIVPMYLGRGDVDLAAELSNAIDDPFSRDKLLTEVAAKCAETGDEEYALQLADAIEDHGIRSQALERIGLVFVSNGKTDAAEQVASLIDHPEFLNAGIAVNAAAGGRESEFRETLGTIDFPKARFSALEQAGNALIANGETEKGLSILQEAGEVLEEIEHDEERLRALCELGDDFLSAKAYDKAVETFDKVKTGAEGLTNQHRDFFLVTAAIGFLNAGSIDPADRALDLVTDKTQMASALLGYARHHWGKDDKQAAEDSLEEAYLILRSQTERETRDSRSRNALFSTIATQFVAFDKTQRGIEAALENPDFEQRTRTLSQIAQVLTLRGDDVDARDTLSMIEDDSDRLYALVAMAAAKRKLNGDPAAAALLDEALELAEAVQQISARAEALSEIAHRYAELGETGKAKAASVECLETIAMIRDESSRASGLAQLAVTYSSVGLEVEGPEQAIIGRLAAQADA
jgi:tetratricopeptide (TPR) repeat protein